LRSVFACIFATRDEANIYRHGALQRSFEAGGNSLDSPSAAWFAGAVTGLTTGSEIGRGLSLAGHQKCPDRLKPVSVGL